MMEKGKDKIIKIYDREESLWRGVKAAAEQSIEEYEKGLILNKELVRLASSKLKNIERRNIKNR